MTVRLSPQREAEIVEWRDLLGASHCAEDAGPHGALNDLLAELAAGRAELAEAQQQLAEYEPLNPQQCPAGKHTDWLVDSEYTHTCPWCQIEDLKAKSERDLDQVMRERDEYHEVADKLANAVAPIEVIGEHSSMNCPWENAYELITPMVEVDQLRAELAAKRDEIAADIHRAELPVFAETENPVLVAKTVRAIDVRLADRGSEAPYWVAKAGDRS